MTFSPPQSWYEPDDEEEVNEMEGDEQSEPEMDDEDDEPRIVKWPE